MEKEQNTSADIIPLIILGGVWAIFHAGILFNHQTFVMEDSSRFFFPLWKWGSNVWAQGFIPLWNSDAGLGTPYLADPQMAAWYPPLFLMYHFFTPVTSFNGLLIGHHLWAMLGAYLFARGRGFSPWVALMGSLVFGFSFNALSLFWAVPMLLTYSWIPWIYISAYGFRDKRKGFFLVFSLTLALQLSAGYPLFFYLTLLTLFFDRLFQLVFGNHRPLKDWVREGSGGIGAVFIALLSNAAWLIPFMEFIPHSDFTGRLQFFQTLHWSDLGTSLNPFINGHPLHSHPETPFSVTDYFMGLPIVAIVVYGTINQRVSKSKLCLLLLLLALSLGDQTFLGSWFKGFWPGYSMVVRSGYWIPFVIWTMVSIFLESLEGLAYLKPKKYLWIVINLIVYITALGLGVPWNLWTFWASFLFTLLGGYSESIYWNKRRIFLTLGLLLSLIPVARSITFTLDRDYYQLNPPLGQALDRSGRIYHSMNIINRYQTVYGAGVADIYRKIKEALAPNWPLCFHLEEAGFENTLFLMSSLKWVFKGGVQEKVQDYLAFRYAIEEKPGPQWQKRMVPGYEDIWFNKDAFPKWFSIQKAIAQKQWNLNQLENESNFEPDQYCYIADPLRAGNYKLRKIEELFSPPNRVILEAHGKGKALLISSESAYPGWFALVEGKQINTEVVNDGFRGVVLDPGEEKVTLEYIPATFRLGFFLSLLILTLWVGMLFNLMGVRILKH